MAANAFMTTAEHQFSVRLSALATCNPFLPERIACEREVLETDFQEVPSVWSKQVRSERENPNVQRLVARAEPVARAIGSRLLNTPGTATPDEKEMRLYEELVFYLLYYRFEAEFERAMSGGEASFYDAFAAEAHQFLALPSLPTGFDRGLPHWFAFLFQVRRASHHIFEFIVGGSLPMARLRGAVWQSIFTHDLRRYRRTLFNKMGDVATLVSGPSGTGKELVARAIGLSRYIPFQVSKRRFAIEREASFFPLNLSAMAPTLIESELFGHRRGAFTGALTDRKGWLAVCPDMGTVFLDEIGELDPGIQVKLLRVLQTRQFQPLGDTKHESFEGKIVAATNRDLATEMRAGRFREDLYYRLCSDLITTPSLKEQLRDAPDDLNDLVLFITQRMVGPEEAEAVTNEVLDWILSSLGASYTWPGNVRELEQCVRNVIIRKEYRPASAASPPSAEDGETLVVDLRAKMPTVEELLARYCAAVYERTGSYLETARRLGLDRRTVKSKVESWREKQQGES